MEEVEQVNEYAPSSPLPPRNFINAEDVGKLQHCLQHHFPDAGQMANIESNRLECFNYGQAILRNCPPSRERSLALTKLEESLFWANAAIARVNTEEG